MIFVTVGTHEQQFNRLIMEIDKLKGEGFFEDEIIIQKGYSTYKPKNCVYFDMIPYKKMESYFKEARLVITHGGPASFLAPLHYGKTPIVVPRQKVFGEHVNNHQMVFCNELLERNFNIIVVNDIKDLAGKIIEYNQNKKNKKFNSNNRDFNVNLEKKLEKLFKEGKTDK